MKRSACLLVFGLMCGIGLLLGGCLIKPARVPTRYLLLAPIPSPEHAPNLAQPLAVDVGLVKMPSYLLRDSVAVRKSATEIEYLEQTLWAERLDLCFQRTLADNLSTLLASNRVTLSAGHRDRMMAKVSVNVKQFDVDTQGQGTLIAGWRITASDSGHPLKSGETHLIRIGPSPRQDPQLIATTLSALTVEFSQELAQAIRTFD